MRTAAQPLIRTRVAHAMTVPFTMQLVAAPDTEPERLDDLADRSIPRIKAWLDHVETVFSPFRADSSVGRARRGDWRALVEDPDFAEVYALCKQAKTLTDGHFDAMHAGAYDPTGLVKGWAVERALDRFLIPLVRAGEVAAAALGGGGDVRTAVAHDSDFVWHIGVADPFAPNTADHPTLRTISLRDGAVATSGTARRGEHITRTAHDLAQATVVDDRLTFADMWATTAIAAGERTFRDLTARHPDRRIMAVLVRADRTVADIA
ncbi:ApbE family [Bifidobacterium sp. DSM 109958]|uniref:FAD:protein FMN transferase n=1 Tax=Bifidobacterium moraviense TaxID=2675323 RepID=A0A7Y0F2Y8_9BIFI|nr:FAD:protein FMN transferase [Bifidobacterium sp. DSM 109958]NMN01080.1 ApbE family [Bifidobacterium sp. DSM 109958]